MAWTHYIKSRIPTLGLTNNPQGDITVVDRSIYVIKYEEMERELQVHIFHVDTSTWDIVKFTDDNSASIPRGRCIAVAHGDSIYVYARNYFVDCSLFVLNTKTLRWNCVSTENKLSGSQRWWGGCLLHGELYILKRGNMNFELWALDLGIMRWRIVSDIELDDSYYPTHIVAYDNRIYMKMAVIFEKTVHVNIVYYDTVNKRWEWMHAPGGCPRLEFSGASFFYSKHFYYFSFMRDQWEFAFRYSLERNNWERITFEGVPPLLINPKSNVIVLDNKAFFINFVEAGVHVLDLEPTLKTRCLAAVSRYKLDTSDLPVSLQTELSKYNRSA